MRHQRHGKQGDLLPARIAKPDGDFHLRAAANRAIVPDTIVSYVKISCTTTGHQPGPNGDVNLPSGLVCFHGAEVTAAFETLVSQYHPRYGALLQVSVGTAHRRSRDLDGGSYPYIAYFEPKERELYEFITETGETMSRMPDGIDARKKRRLHNRAKWSTTSASYSN
jgi:hypothetical protein